MKNDYSNERKEELYKLVKNMKETMKSMEHNKEFYRENYAKYLQILDNLKKYIKKYEKGFCNFKQQEKSTIPKNLELKTIESFSDKFKFRLN
jgi:tRNA U34 5-carboxymethylaminomethyl modifying enzyme MnmG/GidA